MASVFPKVRHQWSENTKVYTRKIKPNNSNNIVNNLDTCTPIFDNFSDKNCDKGNDDNVIDTENVGARIKFPPFSTLPLQSCNGKLSNGSGLRPLVVQVEDRLSISVLGAKSEEEVKDLKRKLEDELDRVRKMKKRVIEKESLIDEYSSIDVEMTNVGPVRDLRPLGRCSVSVMSKNFDYGVVGDVVETPKRTPKANQYYRNSEFVLSKDKLPPKRKKKSGRGKRRGGGNFDRGFIINKKIFEKCDSFLKKLMNHKCGWVFNSPVDVKSLALHDYFDIIKHPMDLGTVKARLTKNWYKTPREFAEDVRLTFHNAMTYNPPGHDVHVMAQDLLRMFEEKWPSIESEYNCKLRYEMICDMGVPTPTSRKTYAPARVSAPMSFPPPPLHPPSPLQEVRELERSQSMSVPPPSRPKPVHSVRRKRVSNKPKANDVYKRDMTLEEKKKLSSNLENLPSERLDALVRIIKKRNSALSQNDNEIEVDIDSVDVETLWELDRFVTNHKKNMSKRKRRAEIAQARAALAKAAQETIQAPANVEVTSETIATIPNGLQHQTNAVTTPCVQQETHGDNVGGSSSSSSDSESSSSDSDSDSSSDSDSDEGG